MKLAVVSAAFPPVQSGQSMVLYRLLNWLDKDAYICISQYDFEDPAVLASVAIGGDYTERLRGTFHHLPPERYVALKPRFFRFRRLLNVFLGIVQRAWHIRTIVRREGAGALMVCSGGYDLLDLPAGYVASRLAGVPFYPYTMDFYSHQWQAGSRWGSYPRLARWAERIMLRGARNILVLNDFMQQALRERYGVEPTVVRHPCDLSDYPAARSVRAPDPDGAVRIVFTGAIYEAHFDAFRNLLAALRLLDRPGIMLHCYTAQLPKDLATKGISGPIVFHPHLPLSEMAAIQQDADILFLPLAFESPFPEIIKTSAPTKLAEYLASGRPILAHAPPDSYLTWYIRKFDCGVIVDRLEPEPLAEAIEQIATDADLRRRLQDNAVRVAKEHYDIDNVRAGFLRALNMEPGVAS